MVQKKVFFRVLIELFLPLTNVKFAINSDADWFANKTLSDCEQRAVKNILQI